MHAATTPAGQVLADPVVVSLRDANDLAGWLGLPPDGASHLDPHELFDAVADAIEHDCPHSTFAIAAIAAAAYELGQAIDWKPYDTARGPAMAFALSPAVA